MGENLYSVSRQSSVLAHITRWIGTAVLYAITLLAAEVTSRVDDWIFQGIPPLTNPTHDSELRLLDLGFVRGRPNGRFKRWHLNSYGFQGHDITQEKPPECKRVMILGASETFGLYESEGRDLAGRLQSALAGSGCFEIINASIAGMRVGATNAYWIGWASKFAPDLIYLYPNPLMSLNIDDSDPPRCRQWEPPKGRDIPPPISSRFISRLRDTLSLPQWLIDLRRRTDIEAERATHAPGWTLAQAPDHCIAMFQMELTNLITDMRESGALVIVATHALSRSGLAESGESFDKWIESWHPRLTVQAQLEYHHAANSAIRTVARNHSVIMFDASRALDGCGTCFADPVHFTDEGAGRLAAAILPLIKVALTAIGNDSHAVQ